MIIYTCYRFDLNWDRFVETTQESNNSSFSGDKKTYQSWKATFTACVDKVLAMAEYKLLQLRQCLAVEAIKTIKKLDHSATAYHTAKERLERKFGGYCCQIPLYLEEVSTSHLYVHDRQL